MIYTIHEHNKKKTKKKRYVHYILYMHNNVSRVGCLFCETRKINTNEMIAKVDLQYIKYFQMTVNIYDAV